MGRNVKDEVMGCARAVRHAEGLHNVGFAHHIPDPHLTPLGHQQCVNLNLSFPHHDTIELLVSSPLRRALYTALHGFATLIHQRGLRVIVLPDVQEGNSAPCDIGSPLEELRKEFDKEFEGVFDFGEVGEEWYVKAGRYAATPDAIQVRAKAAREWLKARPEKEIVLITHGGFISYVTEDPGAEWSNIEYRSYQFAPDSDSASLIETEASSKRRRI
ncbi:hypothetical protein FGG08_004547 [Glutinoglossum americanum]|uniref:Phosphoglycerate mutase-like protein n=1 Tax=Glutinoglossum americanum TaxID=1670608 RepID=A0A9P8L2E2_9PEZI|nr:hypothetical protein FGG08_004547 [Glutinoglossum americanum]